MSLVPEPDDREVELALQSQYAIDAATRQAINAAAGLIGMLRHSHFENMNSEL